MTQLRVLLEFKLECDGFDLYYWVNAGNIIVYLKSTFYSGILQYQGKIISTNDVAASTPLGDISLYTSNQVWPVDFQNDGEITLPFCVEVILPLCQISLCTSNQLSANAGLKILQLKISLCTSNRLSQNSGE